MNEGEKHYQVLGSYRVSGPLGLAALAAPLLGVVRRADRHYKGHAVLMWAHNSTVSMTFFVSDMGFTHYGFLLSEICGPLDAATSRGFEGENEAM